MFQKTTAVIGAVAAVLTLSVAAFAQDPGPVRGDAPGPGFQMPMNGNIPMRMVGVGSQRTAVQAMRIPPAEMMVRFQRQLALTEEQNTKVKALLDKTLEQVKPLAENVNKTTEALVTAVAATPANKTTVDQAATAAIKAETELLTAQTSFWLELKGILTAEQNQRLHTVLARMGMMQGAPREGMRVGPRSPRGPEMPPPGPGPRPGDNLPPVPVE